MRQWIRLVVPIVLLAAGGCCCGARTGLRVPEPRDVERLAFDRTTPAEGTDIWIMEIGRPPVRLTTNASRDHSPAFNPGGVKVAFSSERDVPRAALYEIGIDG